MARCGRDNCGRFARAIYVGTRLRAARLFVREKLVENVYKLRGERSPPAGHRIRVITPFNAVYMLGNNVATRRSGLVPAGPNQRTYDSRRMVDAPPPKSGRLISDFTATNPRRNEFEPSNEKSHVLLASIHVDLSMWISFCSCSVSAKCNTGVALDCGLLNISGCIVVSLDFKLHDYKCSSFFSLPLSFFIIINHIFLYRILF